ncbi:MAG: nucleotidyltransferase [Melioribacteraceae bacterium]|nr:nucleotidyltransferase [Melioribacteraceae bacterium]
MFSKEYFSPDIFDFLNVLTKHKVKFVIVGGEAVIYYGYARLTGDIDLFYDNSNENIENLWSALLEFWDNDIPIIKSKDEFYKKGTVIQFGLPPNRIDLINTIEGVEFSEVWENCKIEQLALENEQYIDIYIIGLNQLIKNKKASGRYKDLEDLEYLTSINNEEL